MRSTVLLSTMGRVRVVLYVAALALIVYAGWRFDTTTLPAEGCSPVVSIPPGSRLFVDVRPGALAHGDRLLFRAPDGELLVGIVQAPPDSAPPEQLARVAAGELWIAADDPRCPARDSRTLGPIPRERVAGRVFLAL